VEAKAKLFEVVDTGYVLALAFVRVVTLPATSQHHNQQQQRDPIE
jgi:hypothetical protein